MNDHFATLNHPNAGNTPRSRCVTVVRHGCRQGRKLEKGRARVEQFVDAVSRHPLPMVGQPVDVFLGTIGACSALLFVELDRELFVMCVKASELRGARLNVGMNACHQFCACMDTSSAPCR